MFVLQNVLGFLLLTTLIVVPTSAFSPHAIARGPRAAQRAAREHSAALHLIPEGTILTDLGSTYTLLLEHHYILTQSFIGGVCSLTGDAIAQAVDRSTGSSVDKKESYDAQRGAVYFCKGLGGGIMWSCWFGIVDSVADEVIGNLLLGHRPPEALEQPVRTVTSILLEQFMVCPTFFSLWDIPLPALLLGAPPRQLPAQVQEKLVPLLVEYGKVWTPVNLITYNIPSEYRVLFANVADIFWQAINAAITSKEIEVSDGAVDAAMVEMVTVPIETESVERKKVAKAETSYR